MDMASAQNHMKEPYAAAEKLTMELGLPPGFIIELFRENDWSFVIKVHALIEGAIKHALSSYFQDYGIDKFIDSLSHRRRIDLAKESRAVQREFIPGLKYISRLRNKIVHDIRNVSYSLESDLTSTSRLNQFEKAILIGGVEGMVEIAGKEMGFRNLLIENPKLAIMRFLVFLLSMIYASIQVTALESQVNEVWKGILQKIHGEKGTSIKL